MHETVGGLLHFINIIYNLNIVHFRANSFSIFIVIWWPYENENWIIALSFTFFFFSNNTYILYVEN